MNDLVAHLMCGIHLIFSKAKDFVCSVKFMYDA